MCLLAVSFFVRIHPLISPLWFHVVAATKFIIPFLWQQERVALDYLESGTGCRLSPSEMVNDFFEFGTWQFHVVTSTPWLGSNCFAFTLAISQRRHARLDGASATSK